MKKIIQFKLIIIFSIFLLSTVQANFIVTVVPDYNVCEDEFGSAFVELDGGVAPFTYNWDNGSIGSSANMLSDGIHTVTVIDATGCVVTTTFEIVLSNQVMLDISASDTGVCAGTAVQLTALTNATAVEWSTGETTETITVTPNSTTTYSLSAITLGNNLIFNGDFEAGDVGFTTAYDLGSGGTWGPLSSEGQYVIEDNANDAHSNFAFCGDHTSGNGNMMVVNGSSDPNLEIWCQTINVTPGNQYQFSAWVATAVSENPAVIQFAIDGVLIGSEFEAPLGTCDWIPFDALWDAEVETSVEICITNQNTLLSGNDFMIDDIYFAQVCTNAVSQTIEVSNLDAAITSTVEIGCLDEFGMATVEGFNGIGDYGYAWSSGESTAMASELSLGANTVTVTDAVCEVVLTANIQGAQLVALDEIITTDPFCPEFGDDFIEVTLATVDFFVGAGTQPFMYSSDGGQTFQEAQLFEELEGGTYNFHIVDAQGCTLDTTITVAPYDFPEVSILATNDAEICGENEVMLSFETTDVFVIQEWSNSSMSDSITITEPGLYEILLVGENGCPGRAALTVTECSDFDIPTIFSPNGDDENDFFGPVAQGGVIINGFNIYNRWGNLVHDNPTPWDGNVNGEICPADVYIYELQMTVAGEAVERRGEVTLLR